MRTRKIRCLGFLPFAFAAFGAVISCVAIAPDQPLDPIDSVDQDLLCETTVLRTPGPTNPSYLDKSIDVGFGINRVARTTCGSSCVKQKECIVKGESVTTCLEWAPDCNAQVAQPIGFTDYASAADAASFTLFPENNEGPSWHYLGCGPQAAMNILNYYGVNKPIDQVYRMMNTIYIKSDAIATYPDDLRDGIQVMLNSFADGAFAVTRHSGVDNVYGLVAGHLAYGWPSIVLVNGGDHYYTVLAAAGGNSFYVIDYPSNGAPGPQPGKWVDVNNLELSINPFKQAGAALALGVGGWLDNTVITIERTGPKPPPQIDNPFLCGINNSMYCCASNPSQVSLLSGRCENQNIRFDFGGAGVESLGYNGPAVQTKELGGCPDHPGQKFDFIPDTPSGAGWYRIMRHDVRLCLAPRSNRSSPDIYTIDCTDCLLDPDRCAWKFTGRPNSVFKLQNKATSKCLYSDNGEVFDNGNGPLHQQNCAADNSDANFKRELFFFDDFGQPCP